MDVLVLEELQCGDEEVENSLTSLLTETVTPPLSHLTPLLTSGHCHLSISISSPQPDTGLVLRSAIMGKSQFRRKPQAIRGLRKRQG
jgi:hypothetical protein